MQSDAAYLASLVKNVNYLDEPLIKNLRPNTLKMLTIQLQSLDFGIFKKLNPKNMFMILPHSRRFDK